MAATLTLEQVRTNDADGFSVLSTITESDDIPKELFVYRQIDDGYDHVAILNDLQYPTVNTPGTPYYRKDLAKRSFADVVTALDFATHVKTRVDGVLAAYNEGPYEDFPGTFEFELPEP